MKNNIDMLAKAVCIHTLILRTNYFISADNTSIIVERTKIIRAELKRYNPDSTLIVEQSSEINKLFKKITKPN